MRTVFKGMGVAAAAAAVLMTGTGPAAAAPGGWNLPSGQGSTKGTAEFFDRSIRITGDVTSHWNGCVHAKFSTKPDSTTTTRTACEYGTTGFNFTHSTNFPGGARTLDIDLYKINPGGSTTFLGRTSISRP
ncbi:hypothetical protein [Streptomyces sp. NPDC047315]|uniref:hypothetical protein n=1 Tax=Streptomyces sp. NPDC047315 TaxID=3155142 RepID=UPI0033F37EEF